MDLLQVKISDLHWAQSVETCKENDNLEVVIDKLKNKRIGSIVIVNDQQIPIGIFTERDLLTKVHLHSPHFLDEKIKTYMTPNPKTVRLTDSLRHGALLMRIGKFRHLVIVDSNGTLCGVLSVKDLLDYILDQMNEIK